MMHGREGEVAGRPVPRLHVVTDDRVLERPGLLESARAVLEAGCRDVALHVRGPRTPGARLHAVARTLVPVAAAAGALLIVNDRVDVALTTGADGAHLGRRSLGVRQTKRILGARAWVGVSTHTPEEAAAASGEGADFAFVGTVYGTPTHPDRAGDGEALVRSAVRTADGLPLLAIGGVSRERVESVLDAGAHGVAVIRGVWDAGDPAEAVKGYLERLRDRTAVEAGVKERGLEDR